MNIMNMLYDDAILFILSLLNRKDMINMIHTCKFMLEYEHVFYHIYDINFDIFTQTSYDILMHKNQRNFFVKFIKKLKRVINITTNIYQDIDQLTHIQFKHYFNNNVNDLP